MDDDTIAQFTEVTGSTAEIATQYLEIADYDIQQAMQLYFENGGAEIRPSAPSHATPTASHPSESAQNTVQIDSDDDLVVDEARSSAPPRPQAGGAFEDDAAMARRLQEELYSGGDSSDGVRAPIARTTETLVGPGAESYGDLDPLLDQFRMRQARNTRPGIFNQRDTSIWDQGAAEPSQRADLARATGGASEASSKSTMLAEMYRPPFELMSKLQWDEAREEGRETEKWLLINIQDPSIFDCQLLNRDLWKDPSVRDTVKENFIFLQFNKDDQRGIPYLQYYFQNSDVPDNYPHIAIVDPRTGEQVKVWSGPPVVKPPDFLMQLHEFLDRYSLKQNARNPVAKRKASVPKEKQLDAMTEEEMMEMALKNSLEGPAAQGIEDPDELTRSVGDLKGKGKAVDVDDLMGDEEPEEPEDPSVAVFRSIPSDQTHTEPAADPATTTRIQFRHPSGRVIRRFALADPVRRIYEWLKSEPPLEDKAGLVFELNAMGKNLVEELDTSIQDAGLKNGTIMIGYVED